MDFKRPRQVDEERTKILVSSRKTSVLIKVVKWDVCHYFVAVNVGMAREVSVDCLEIARRLFVWSGLVSCRSSLHELLSEFSLELPSRMSRILFSPT